MLLSDGKLYSRIFYNWVKIMLVGWRLFSEGEPTLAILHKISQVVRKNRTIWVFIKNEKFEYLRFKLNMFRMNNKPINSRIHYQQYKQLPHRSLKDWIKPFERVLNFKKFVCTQEKSHVKHAWSKRTTRVCSNIWVSFIYRTCSLHVAHSEGDTKQSW